jgi:ArsR family transcriptional regulator
MNRTSSISRRPAGTKRRRTAAGTGASRPPGSRAACPPSVTAAPLSEAEAAALARGFCALSDPARLRLLSILAAAPEGEACVCELVELVGRSQGTVSHHLKTLAEAGLVRGERRGRWVWYSLEGQRLAALRLTLGS